MEAKTVHEVYETLADAVIDLADATRTYAASKTQADKMRTDIIAHGLVTGKNQAERDANIDYQMADLLAQLALAEENLRDAKTRRELAQLSVDEVRLLVRLEELVAGGRNRDEA